MVGKENETPKKLNQRLRKIVNKPENIKHFTDDIIKNIFGEGQQNPRYEFNKWRQDEADLKYEQLHKLDGRIKYMGIDEDAYESSDKERNTKKIKQSTDFEIYAAEEEKQLANAKPQYVSDQMIPSSSGQQSKNVEVIDLSMSSSRSDLSNEQFKEISKPVQQPVQQLMQQPAVQHINPLANQQRAQQAVQQLTHQPIRLSVQQLIQIMKWAACSMNPIELFNKYDANEIPKEQYISILSFKENRWSP